MENIVSTLSANNPRVRFRRSDRFYWSPATNEVYYDISANLPDGLWSLLHETGHALLGHCSYKADYELIRLEVAAWEEAKNIATGLGMTIDDDHIQDCIDTYRDWLNNRSICPRCSNRSLQQAELAEYRCFNCHKSWKVTPSRFCRAYRATKNATETDPIFGLDNDYL